jgi:hypothetical protein
MTTTEAIKAMRNIVEYWATRPSETEAAKMAIAAIKTLDKLGYTCHGAELWKPPLGKPPKLGCWVNCCSECGKASAVASHYCPQCGAKNIKEDAP